MKDFDVKMSWLQQVIEQAYKGNIGIIHGDFFPGNVLVNEQDKGPHICRAAIVDIDHFNP